MPITSYMDVLPVVPTADLPEDQPRSRAGGFHRLHIRRKVELKDYDFTPGCAGCDAARLKLPPVAHSEACRARERLVGATALSDLQRGLQLWRRN